MSAAPSVPKKRGRPSFADIAAREGKSIEEIRSARRNAPIQREEQSPEAEEERRTLPEDAEEADKALAPLRVPARLVVKTVDKTYEWLEVSTLDSEEKDQGTTAIATVMYEEGANFSGRLLLLLWIICTCLPRVIEFMDNRKKRIEEEKKQKAMNARPEGTIP